MLNCKNLRGAVLTSGLLLIAAWIVEAFAHAPLLPSITAAYTGFVLLLAAVAVLAGTFLLSLLPANARRLRHCEH